MYFSDLIKVEESQIGPCKDSPTTAGKNIFCLVN